MTELLHKSVVAAGFATQTMCVRCCVGWISQRGQVDTAAFFDTCGAAGQ